MEVGDPATAATVTPPWHSFGENDRTLLRLLTGDLCVPPVLTGASYDPNNPLGGDSHIHFTFFTD